MTDSSSDEILQAGVQVLYDESAALLSAAEKIGSGFIEFVDFVAEQRSLVVVTGLGKSGHVGKKIAATFSSTGSPAVFVHASEALHGDLGVLSSGVVLLAIAFGGETKEVVEVARFAKRNDIPVCAITGNISSSLAKLASYLIDGSVVREACHLNLAPTSSSTVALALGDAMAVAIMKRRGFDAKGFAKFHPGGRLGIRLSRVCDHMMPDPILVDKSAEFGEILAACTLENYGIVGVIDERSHLVGAITDGDLRRAIILNKEQVFQKCAQSLMSGSPKVISDNEHVFNAVDIMERHKITSVFVSNLKDVTHVIGIIRMHDILAAKII